MAAGAAGLFLRAAPHCSQESPCDSSRMIPTAFELVPLRLIDIPAVPSEPKSHFDLRHGPNRNVQVSCELPTTTFGATFCNVCGHGERCSPELGR